MSEDTVFRLALVLAKQAEIEGMKAMNQQREAWGESPAYDQSHFEDMANQLESLAHCHIDQLRGI